MKYILFNPLSNNKQSKETLALLEEQLKGEEYVVKNILEENQVDIVRNLKAEDEVVILGGDGTLNRFVNDLNDEIPSNNIYIFGGGSGNDFLNDLGKKGGELVLINKYLVNLPTVTINGKKSFFINGIGFGIDGYCCEEGDRQRAASVEKINYTSIAIKGLLFKFKRRKATVTIDGVTKSYKHVWLAPVMNGRFYGGGMMVAPAQDRLNEKHELTNVVFCGKSKITTLIKFPKIFTGEHIKFKNSISVQTGHKFKVEFNTPCALQIDGETVLNVSSYEVEAYNG